MALFKKREDPGPAAVPPAAAAPEPDLRETIGRLSAALDTFATGDLRDSNTMMTITSCLDAGMAPFHFPETSIWAQSLPFADKAASIGQWLIVVKLHKISDFWNDDMGPAIQQSNPNFIQLIGWARPADRLALRQRAFDAAQHLPPDTLIFTASGETIGNFLLAESTALGRTVDWLANPEPPPPPEPTTRERIDAVIARARQGDADAIAFEKALAAGTDEESRRFLEEAASLGSIDAMESAAEMAHAAGDTQSELFWAETAANTGSIKGMNRLAAIHFNTGQLAAASSWLERAGQAGDSNAYWLLAQLANERNDPDTALKWSELGSLAGNAECMRMKGTLILNNQGRDGLVAAHSLFVEAARRGSDQAMVQAGQLAASLNHQAQAAYWFTHALDLGNEQAAQLLSGNAPPATNPVPNSSDLLAGDSDASATSWEYARIWYGQEGDMQNPGQMMWSAQIKWPDQERLDLRDRVPIESVLADVAQSGWEVESVQPASGINAQDYTLRRRRT